MRSEISFGATGAAVSTLSLAACIQHAKRCLTALAIIIVFASIASHKRGKVGRIRAAPSRALHINFAVGPR